MADGIGKALEQMTTCIVIAGAGLLVLALVLAGLLWWRW